MTVKSRARLLWIVHPIEGENFEIQIMSALDNALGSMLPGQPKWTTTDSFKSLEEAETRLREMLEVVATEVTEVLQEVEFSVNVERNGKAVPNESPVPGWLAAL